MLKADLIRQIGHDESGRKQLGLDRTARAEARRPPAGTRAMSG